MSPVLLLSTFIVGCTGDTDPTNPDGSETSETGDPKPPPPTGETGTSNNPVGLDERPTNDTCVAVDRPNLGGQADVERVFTSQQFSAPIAMLQAPGDPDHWFVATQGGDIFRFDNDPAVTTRTQVLDLGVQNFGEMGLLSMAFHPDFQSNGYLYVYGSWAGGGGGVNHLSRITRYTSSDGGATFDAGSETLILQFNQPFSNHNGGTLAFGPDGHLYLGTGDGGSGGDPLNAGQSLDTLLGKMLRLDVDGGDPYAIPPTNPFAGGGGEPEIYAWGLRNPFRMSFDPVSGDLWVGDVGQNSREEISLVQLGGNYGWRIMEGDQCHSPSFNCDTSNLVLPVVAYGLADIGGGFGLSVIAGEVYRGTAIPELQGVFLFNDYFDDTIRGVVTDPVTGEAAMIEVVPGAGNSIVHYTQGADGEVYFVNQGNGRLYRLIPSVSGGPGDAFPRNLADTGCMDPNDPSQPGPALIPYEMRHPFWSDDATKERWMAIPDGTQLVTQGDGDVEFPVGTVLVKQFRRAGRLLETRLMMLHDDGWGGYSYVWNDEGTEAIWAPGGTVIQADGDWVVPNGGECVACHTSAAGGSLGLETSQLTQTAITYPATGRTADQLTTLDGIGLFDPPLSNLEPDGYSAVDDTDASVESRARAYLHVNCSMCHRPGVSSRAMLDLRYDTELSATGLCEAPSVGDLGLPNARVVSPGNPASSVLLERMRSRGPYAMPPIGSLRVDQTAATVVEDWIQNLNCP